MKPVLKRIFSLTATTPYVQFGFAMLLVLAGGFTSAQERAYPSQNAAPSPQASARDAAKSPYYWALEKGRSKTIFGCTSGQSCNPHDDGSRILLGRSFESFGLDVGYSNYGRSSISVSSGERIDMRASAFSLGVNFGREYEHWMYYTRLGIGRTTLSQVSTGFSPSSGTIYRLTSGAGVGVRAFGNTFVTLNYSAGSGDARSEAVSGEMGLRLISLGVYGRF